MYKVNNTALFMLVSQRLSVRIMEEQSIQLTLSVAEYDSII